MTDVTGAPGAPQGQTGINVQTKFFPLAWFYFFLKPQLSLDDGAPVTNRWGKSFIPASPGSHSLRCYVNYVIPRRLGDSTVTVQVPPGGVVTMRWHAPYLAFMQGKWKQIGEPTPAPVI